MLTRETIAVEALLEEFNDRVLQWPEGGRIKVATLLANLPDSMRGTGVHITRRPDGSVEIAPLDRSETDLDDPLREHVVYQFRQGDGSTIDMPLSRTGVKDYWLAPEGQTVIGTILPPGTVAGN